MTPPRPSQRLPHLTQLRNKKMARSAHAYVRGSTVQFYEWLHSQPGRRLPQGPAIWICGDCHAGNLGPTANSKGEIDIHIRDLDQAVIGNPAHDLVRLALSLATAARGSDLPGVTTARMLEEMMRGYEQAFADRPDEAPPRPAQVKASMRSAVQRTWKILPGNVLKMPVPPFLWENTSGHCPEKKMQQYKPFVRPRKSINWSLL